MSENFDWLVLDRGARAALSLIADGDARELARDFFLDQRFRTDVFARGNRRLDPEERAGRLLARTYALAKPRPAIRYVTTTPAGSFCYDNPVARALVRGLPPARTPSPASPRQTNLLTLCAARRES